MNANDSNTVLEASRPSSQLTGSLHRTARLLAALANELSDLRFNHSPISAELLRASQKLLDQAELFLSPQLTRVLRRSNLHSTKALAALHAEVQRLKVALAR